MPVDERTQVRRRAVHNRPEVPKSEEPSASCFDSAWKNDGERKRSSEGTGCDGADVPVLSGSSAPASVMNLPAPEGMCPPPRGRLCWGEMPPIWTFANATAAAAVACQRTNILFSCLFVLSNEIAWLSVRRSKSNQPPGACGTAGGPAVVRARPGALLRLPGGGPVVPGHACRPRCPAAQQIMSERA